MSYLDQLVTTKVERKPAYIFYSEPGDGKTSLMCQFQDIVVAYDPLDPGVLDLKLSGSIPESTPTIAFQTFEVLDGLVDELLSKPHNYKWLGIDGWMGFVRCLYDYVGRAEYGGDMSDKGFYAFQKGPKVATPPYLDAFIAKLEKLRDRGMGIIFLAHAKVNEFNDPINGKYNYYNIDGPESLVDVLYRWATSVGFITRAVTIDKASQSLKGGTTRIMYLASGGQCIAKNREGITNILPLGSNPKQAYDSFCKAIYEARQANVKSA